MEELQTYVLRTYTEMFKKYSKGAVEKFNETAYFQRN